MLKARQKCRRNGNMIKLLKLLDIKELLEKLYGYFSKKSNNAQKHKGKKYPELQKPSSGD